MYPVSIYDLLVENKLDIALDRIEGLEDANSLEGDILKAQIFELQGKYLQSLDLITKAKLNASSIGNTRLTLASISIILHVYYRLKEYDIIEPEINDGDKVLQALVSEFNGNDNQEWRETANLWIGSYYNIKAVIRKNKGLNTIALDFFEISLKYRKKLRNKLYVGMTLNNIGNLYLIKGEYVPAISYYRQAYEYAKSDEQNHLMLIIDQNIGITNYYLGEWQKSLDHLQMSIDRINQYSYPEKYSLGYIYKTLSHLALGEMDNAREQIEILHKMKVEHNLKELDLHYDLTYALFLKSQRRFINRAEAQILLRKIIDQEIIDIALTRLAMINMSDLLLEEYSIFGNEEAFEELNLLISTLYQVAQQQETIFLMIEVLIFQSKFMIINGNRIEAEELLDRASNLAMVNGIDRLVEKVKALRVKIEKDVDHWVGKTNEDHTVRTELLNYLSELGPLVSEKK